MHLNVLYKHARMALLPMNLGLLVLEHGNGGTRALGSEPDSHCTVTPVVGVTPKSLACRGVAFQSWLASNYVAVGRGRVFSGNGDHTGPSPTLLFVRA